MIKVSISIMSYMLDYHFTTETMNYLKDTCNVHNFSKENEDKYILTLKETEDKYIKAKCGTIHNMRKNMFLKF